MKCSLCGLDIEITESGWAHGNNPAPLGKPTDRCCDWCDKHLVIPLRIHMFQNQSKLSGKAASFVSQRTLPADAFDGGKING